MTNEMAHGIRLEEQRFLRGVREITQLPPEAHAGFSADVVARLLNILEEKEAKHLAAEIYFGGVKLWREQLPTVRKNLYGDDK